MQVVASVHSKCLVEISVLDGVIVVVCYLSSVTKIRNKSAKARAISSHILVEVSKLKLQTSLL